MMDDLRHKQRTILGHLEHGGEVSERQVRTWLVEFVDLYQAISDAGFRGTQRQKDEFHGIKKQVVEKALRKLSEINPLIDSLASAVSDAVPIVMQKTVARKHIKSSTPTSSEGGGQEKEKDEPKRACALDRKQEQVDQNKMDDLALLTSESSNLLAVTSMVLLRLVKEMTMRQIVNKRNHP